jgi:hypothetical protein
MPRFRVALLVVAVVGLLVAASAAAFSSDGVVGALRPVVVAHVSSTSSRSTCQAGPGRDQKAGSTSLTGTRRKPGVVACEQPPRSEPSAPALEQAQASALAGIG